MGNAGDLKEYSTACELAAVDFIERSTRFNVKDVRILDARPLVRRFSVTIRHELESVSEVEDVHGRQGPGAADFVTADWNRYQELVTAQAQSELTRPETMDELIATVKCLPYAAISARTHIRTHPRRFFHTYTCKACAGAGNVRCHGCAGSGQVACGSCGGSGRHTCSSCGGSGRISQHRTVTDHNGYTRSEMQTHACSGCAGGSVTCFSCGGSGRRQCGSCGGTGRVTCMTCSGHGCLTRITTTHTYTNPRFSGRHPAGTPDYVHEALCKADFANLARHGRIALRDVVESRAQSAVEFVYDCTMPFCELTVDVMGLRSEWVLFGQEPRIFDAGGALEALLESDAARLRVVATNRSRWFPWFHASARKAVAPFMESELNQELVAASAAGLAPAAILERVNRAVSESYIHDALRDLRRSVRIAAHWSRIKWIFAFALLSIPFSLLATAYLQRDRNLSLTGQAQRLFLQAPGPFGLMWEAGLLTIPFAVLGCLCARWMSRRWLRRAGGGAILTWAERQGLLLGKWTALTMIAAACGAAGVFFNRWPLWIDGEGKAYGVFALFKPPQQVLAPVAPKPPVTEPSRARRGRAERHP